MIELTYMPPVSWLIWGGLLMAGLVSFSYLRTPGRAGRGLRLSLIALRCVVIGMVVLCLLGPEWVEAIKRQPKSRVAVLVDTSRSMTIKDVPHGRISAAKTWLQDNFGPSLPAHVTPDYFAFNQELTPLSSVQSANANGDATALAGALEDLLTVPSDDPLTAVLVCSDGIENVRQNPESIAKIYRRKGIPIHTATVGTTNQMQDIIVENVQVKRAVPNFAPTRIAITLRTSGYQNQTVPVQIRGSNLLVAMQSVRLTEGDQRVEIDFTPRQRGFQTYEVAVPVQSGEWLSTNNRKVFGVDVVDPVIRVIYMEGTPQQPASPIPEWKYLKDALESDPHIKVKTLYRQLAANGQFLNTVDSDPDTGEKVYPVEHPTQGFPRTLAELLKYDVIIHSDIRTDSFNREQMLNMARLVEEHGGGFVMIGGNSAFGKGGYHRTILDRIIPVAMQQENDSQARSFRLSVPPAAFAHPLMALGATPRETAAIWTQKFPILYGCNLVDRAKPGAVILGQDTTARNSYGPRLILAVQHIGKGRSMAFTSDTTRSWGKDFETLWGEPINPQMPITEQNCDSRYYRQFWVNAVRWLAAGRIGRTNNPVTLELAQSYCLPNETVSATVKVRDDQLRPIAAADVSLWISNDGHTNSPVKLSFDRVEQSYRAHLTPPATGDFIVTALATLKGQHLGEDRQSLVCEEGTREMADLRARPDVMSNIARLSGGQSLPIEASDAPPAASLFGIAPPLTVNYQRTPLWDNAWWLAFVLLLLAVEWSVRRIRGMA